MPEIFYTTLNLLEFFSQISKARATNFFLKVNLVKKKLREKLVLTELNPGFHKQEQQLDERTVATHEQ